MPSLSEPAGSTTRPRILVIEDARPLLLMAFHMLKREFEVDQAATADQALQLLEERTYDVVLADINLGGPVTGSDIMHRYHTLHPESRTAFIAVTTLVEGGKQWFLAQGFEDYVSKPYTQLDLVVAIRGVLGRRGE